MPEINKEQLSEILDKKLSEMTEEMLKKTADVKKVEVLEKQISELEAKTQRLTEVEKTNTELKNSLELLEKKMSMPAGGGKSEDSELEEYTKSFEQYTRKGIEIPDEISKKCLNKFYGESASNIEYGLSHGFMLLDKKTLRVQNDPEGGYTVYPQLKPGMVERTFETTPMRELADVMQISATELDILLDDDEFTSGGWVGEEGTRSVTNNGKLGKITIVTHEQYAQPRVTQKLLDDSSVNISEWILKKTNDILTRTENTSFVTGSGASQPKGFLSYSAWAVAGTYERNKIEQINSGANGSITYNGLVETQDALLDKYQGNAVWMMNRTALTKIKELVDGNGRPLLNMDGLREGFAPRLLGKRVVFSSDMTKSSSFTTGTLAIAYGDFKETYQIVDRIGVRVLRDQYTAKPYILFYTTKRVGGGAKNFESMKINKLSA